MAEYKLIYFDLRGRGELARWIFKQGSIPFTDERVTLDQWAAKKPTIPGGKLPVLVVREHTMPQSLAICRFAAKKANLVPNDDLQAAFVDALADTLIEVLYKFYDFAFPEVNDGNKAQVDEYMNNDVASLAEKLEKRIAGREWYVSDKMTWGDLAIGYFFNELKMHKLEILPKYPALQAHYNKVTSLPKIKDWLNTRPKNSF